MTHVGLSDREKIMHALLIRKRRYVTHGGWTSRELMHYTGLDERAFVLAASKLLAEGVIFVAKIDGYIDHADNCRLYLTNSGIKELAVKAGYRKPKDKA
jgi:hypothetical protein